MATPPELCGAWRLDSAFMNLSSMLTVAPLAPIRDSRGDWFRRANARS